jgi:hypothetical protein
MNSSRALFVTLAVVCLLSVGSTTDLTDSCFYVSCNGAGRVLVDGASSSVYLGSKTNETALVYVGAYPYNADGGIDATSVAHIAGAYCTLGIFDVISKCPTMKPQSNSKVDTAFSCSGAYGTVYIQESTQSVSYASLHSSSGVVGMGSIGPFADANTVSAIIGSICKSGVFSTAPISSSTHHHVL